MPDTFKIETTVRKDLGTKPARKVRGEARIPAVLYGHGQENVHLSIPAKEFTRSFEGGNRLFELRISGKTETAMLIDVQWDTYGDMVIHADFARTNLDEKVQVNVRINFKGIPAGVKAGGLLHNVRDTILVECSAGEIPEELRVDISHLEIGESLHVGDISYPAGCVSVDAPELVVLNVTQAEEVAVPEEAEAAAAVVPEVITERKTDTEGGEET
ncbi:50S ribosomal protein L25 [Planctomycetota bacterium]